jgi:hypothetical protein
VITAKTVKDGRERWRLDVQMRGMLLASVLALSFAFAPAALAAPKGIFAKFAQCPTSKPGVVLCQYLEVTRGMFSIGKESIPIEKTLVIQGGSIPVGGSNPNEYYLTTPVGGEGVSSDELEVPGGIRALLNCPQEGCNSPTGGKIPNAVFATIELATSPSNRAIVNLAAATEGNGSAVTVPVRVQLRNQLLGKACYLGSEAQPIELRLTDGTTSPPPPNKPISGTPGEATSEAEYEYEATFVPGVTLVDNAFSVPLARGCGGSLAFIIDPMIDRTLGLESVAGRNAVMLKLVVHMADAKAVLASEAFPSR